MRTINCIYRTIMVVIYIGVSAIPASSQTIEVKPFQVKNGWGYKVFIDGKQYLNQEHIPAIEGYHQFKTQQDAEKAGALVVTKIRKNIMPPTISPEELDSIGVLPAEVKAAQPKPVKAVKPVQKSPATKELKPAPNKPVKQVEQK